MDDGSPSTQNEQTNQASSSHQTRNDGVEIQNVEQQRVGTKQQIVDTESQAINTNHQIVNVEHSELEPESEQGRGNDPKIFFLAEPKEEPRTKLHALTKYVKRHHKPDQIIGMFNQVL